MDVQSSVQQRYGDGAAACEQSLCCAVSYDTQYLKVIPAEVIERDYGCGDPSKYVREGETVLDLGSGGGKICFIASQIVGSEGRVIGVDMTPEMLQLARDNAPKVAEKIGYSNVSFYRGHIEDLKTDLDQLEAYLTDNPVASVSDYEKLNQEIAAKNSEQPMIADNSVDVIVSNCVLNLVSDEKKHQLFAEMFRVLKPGGRIAVSDIVSDEVSPPHLKKDSKLWSGCISGALTEHGFAEALVKAGFHGVTYDVFEEKPWQIVEGIEYRSVTLLAYKGEAREALDKNHAVIYQGPWAEVRDDEGNVYYRGERMAVSDRIYDQLNRAPYSEQIVAIPPHQDVETDAPFSGIPGAIRDPQKTKLGSDKITSDPSQGCC